MITEPLTTLFTRDLNKLKQELSLYTAEEKIWIVKEGISNSAGNLSLHLAGNLKHFIGATLGNTGYIRNRELEFSTTFVERSVLLSSIDETIEIIKNTLTKISATQLQQDFPVNVFGNPMTTEQFLLHLFGHLNYHLGQVNYHRRLIGQ
ncbi:MAG: DUF1572 family protein [Bacteroidetes bacterium]|nr:DUF1572 family protein [Bacteroidota bacterium]